ncbi:MAG: transcription antitermination protein NusB [Muribaculaceae bacterium]|nr:transcription antitermination protein NusB [Muribaculaceae bacterium]
MIESQPSAPTKEKRFAYSLYLDMLVLMVKIAEDIEKRGGYRPLEDTRFIKKILADEKVNSMLGKYRYDAFPLQGVVDSVADQIKESGIYKNYLKNLDSENGEDDQIWERLFNIVIMANPLLNSNISKRENYTIRGVDRMKDMMNETFKNFYSSRDNIEDALKTLAYSMDKARELYFRLLILPVELTNLRERQIDDNRNKYVPTEADLNPNMRFVENGLVEALRNDKDIDEYVERTKLSWMPEDRVMLEALLKDIMDSDLYAEYMEIPTTDFQIDCEFWRNVFKQIIFRNEEFLETLETKSVFWNDDLEIIGTFFLKTIKRFEEGGHDCNPVLAMYKDEEDASFGKQLFAEVVRNKDVYRRYIEDSIKKDKWDAERLPFMDVVIAMTALAEIVNFPKIPLAVSINEYIEIAKSYSTNKSGAFLNGILFSITNRLHEEGKIQKK